MAKQVTTNNRYNFSVDNAAFASSFPEEVRPSALISSSA